MVITIDDEGPGLPNNDPEKVFEPFFTTREAGTGLGLANVKKIIDYHDGIIRATNRNDKGARFAIILPRRKN